MSGQGLEAWVEARRRKVLGRVRLAGLAVGLVLLGATGWLGWREARLAGLPGQTAQAVAGQASAETLLRMKYFSLAAYLAKIRQGALLTDIVGTRIMEAPCARETDLMSLPAGSECRAAWEDALRRIWTAAFDGQGPLPYFLPADRWGSPFLLGLSEASCGMFGPWCPPDTLRSAGPDGRPETPDDILVSLPQHLGPSRVQQP